MIVSITASAITNLGSGFTVDRQEFAAKSKPLDTYGCVYDWHCYGNAYCFAGECYESECKEDTECDKGVVCRGGFCIDIARNDADCKLDNNCPYYPYQKCMESLGKCYAVY